MYATITVTGKIERDGVPAQGKVKITPSVNTISDLDGNVVLYGPLTAVLDGTGAFSIDCPATDDVNLDPQNFGYTISFDLASGVLPDIKFGLPTAVGASIDLTDLYAAAGYYAEGDWTPVLVGEQGPQGIQGIQGLKGDKGDQGIQGIQGIQGFKGDKGDKGDTGDTGPANVLTKGIVTTVDYATGADVTISGVSPNQTIDFQIPAGPIGPQGIQGLKGDPGEGSVNSVNGDLGPDVVLDKTDIGLANVDNTSDINKPVSTAQQTALNAKLNKAGDTATGNLEAPSFSMTPTVGTAKGRFGMLPGVEAWTGMFVNCSFNGAAWVLDDITKPGWFFKLDSRAVAPEFAVYRIPAGPNPHTDETFLFKVGTTGLITVAGKITGVVDATGNTDAATLGQLNTALAAKANSVHNHAAGDINSGVLSAARLGTGAVGDGSRILKDNGTWGTPPSSASYFTEVFTASGTWTPPANVKSVDLVIINAGSGGASGARGLSGSGAGGTGGSKGSIAIMENVPISGNPVTITVGAGGAGGVGVSQSSSTTAAVAGSAGGASSFGTLTTAGASPYAVPKAGWPQGYTVDLTTLLNSALGLNISAGQAGGSGTPGTGGTKVFGSPGAGGPANGYVFNGADGSTAPSGGGTSPTPATPSNGGGGGGAGLSFTGTVGTGSKAGNGGNGAVGSGSGGGGGGGVSAAGGITTAPGDGGTGGSGLVVIGYRIVG